MKIKTFFERYTKRGLNGCLEYTGARNKAGYGLVRVKRGDKWTCQPASRWVWEQLRRVKLERWQFVTHSCGNAGCVNLSHLRADTTVHVPVQRGEYKQQAIAQAIVEAIRIDARAAKEVAATHGVSLSYVSKIRSGKIKRRVQPTTYSSPLLARIMSGD